MVQAELSEMSRIIGRSAGAGIFPAGKAPFKTKAAQILVSPEKLKNIFTMQGGGVGTGGCFAAFSQTFSVHLRDEATSSKLSSLCETSYSNVISLFFFLSSLQLQLD